MIEEEVEPTTLAKAKTPALRQAAQASAAYRQLLAETLRCDFATLQLHFKTFLTTPLATKFTLGDPVRELPGLKHVLVDEYQDTNPIQESIYLTLAKATGGNITVVGDDDQALYRFRGGTVECLIRFPQRCKSVLGVPPTTVQLLHNYRSLPDITHWAEHIISAQPAMRKAGARTQKRRMINDRSNVEGYRPLACIQGKDREDTAQKVAHVIKTLITTKLVNDAADIAILLRSARESPTHAGPVAAALRALKVPFYNPRSKAFLEAEEVAGMLGALLETLDRGSEVGGTLRGFVGNSIATWRLQYRALARKHDSLRGYIATVHHALAKRQPGEFLSFTLRDLFYRLLSREPFSAWQENPTRTYRLGQLSAILESFASVEESDTLRVSRTSHGRISLDLLDRVTSAVTAAAEAISGPIWNQIWNQNAPKSQIGHSDDSEVPDLIGGPSRTRTLDPLIKSLGALATVIYADLH